MSFLHFGNFTEDSLRPAVNVALVITDLKPLAVFSGNQMEVASAVNFAQHHVTDFQTFRCHRLNRDQITVVYFTSH
jgi:hypothetical protein